MVKLELGQTVDKLGNLFNSFRNTQTKDDAIGKVFKTFTSVVDGFNVDVFASNDNKFMSLAGDIAKSLLKSGAISGGLAMAGATEGLSVIPALFESVLDGIAGLFGREAPKDESFFPGEWISIESGFVEDTDEDRFARTEMFGDDDLEMEIPNYNVGFFIQYGGVDDHCMVFDAREGRVKQVAVPDIRSIPDQSSLDGNAMLREVKEIYFKKEGKQALAKTSAEVAIGKDVIFNDILYNVLEFEPVKQLVHLVREGEVIETALKNLVSFDATSQLTWLDGKTMNQLPRTLVKYGYCWLQRDNFEVLCMVNRIASNTVEVIELTTGKSSTVPNSEPTPVSDRFGDLLASVAEFRRFREAVTKGRVPWEIYKYRYLCKQSAVNRSVDKLDKKALTDIAATQKREYGFIDQDLTHEIESMEVAYGEKILIDEMEDF